MKIKLLKIATVLSAMFLINGCQVVSANRVFPKFDWYWSADAKEQRRENELEKQLDEEYRRNNENKK